MDVSPTQFLVLANTLKLGHIDPQPLMRRAGLPDIGAAKSAAWRSVGELDAMMRIGREATGDAGFGLVVAQSLAQSLYGVLAQLTMHAPTLRAVLDDLQKYTRLFQVRNELSCDTRGGRCLLRIAPLGTSADGRRTRTEQIMGGLLTMLRYYGVGQADIHHVHVAHRRPEYASRYACVFGPSVHFAQATCEIVIDASMLDAEQPARSAAFYGQLKAAADGELAEVLRSDTTAAAVGRLLTNGTSGLPTLQEVARRLGLSERTLRRRLASEGRSWGRLLDEHRQAAVTQMLSRGDVPLKQIAVNLGYASISSFHRAFRQRHGTTPLQWKRRHLEAMSIERSPSGS